MNLTKNFRPLLSVARVIRRRSEDAYFLSHVRRLLSRVDHPDPYSKAAMVGELGADLLKLEAKVLEAVADRLGAP